MVLTDVHERIAGHGVTGKGQFPAGLMSEAAGEGVLTVTHSARLELTHTHKQNKMMNKFILKKFFKVEGCEAQTAADLRQVVLLQQRFDERLCLLFGNLGVIC